MKRFEIDERLAVALLNYLGERPHREVAGFIAALSHLRPIETPQDQECEAPKKKDTDNKQK